MHFVDIFVFQQKRVVTSHLVPQPQHHVLQRLAVVVVVLLEEVVEFVKKRCMAMRGVKNCQQLFKLQVFAQLTLVECLEVI
jgi:hypothetical protein